MPGQDDDGLDASAWERLRIVTSATDRATFKGEFASWPSTVSLPEQHRIGLYLFAAVKCMIRFSVRGDPSEADLKSLAARCFPDVQTVLVTHPMAVEDALRTAFRLPPIRRKLRPGELLVLNAAIARSLLDQLGTELGGIRDWVAEWWRVNARTIHDIGVQDH